LNGVVVEASRYALWRDTPPYAAQITATELDIVPTLGKDPLRALARLPGTASNDFSARVHVRGGDADEMLVRLDGLRLYSPFHLKDFQGVFSAIDAVLVDRIDVYTGGYPAHLGERMSGVIDIHSIDVPDVAHREISLSVFHGAALASGHLNDGASDWLVSARRGNLDLILDWTKSDLGTPNYTDLYGRFSHRVSDAVAVSGNFLMLDDNIRLNDSDREEVARAEYRDTYAWLNLDYATDELDGRLLFARTQLDSERRGSADQSGIGRGMLEDLRAHSIDSAVMELAWAHWKNATLRAGAEWRQLSGRYDYTDRAEFDLVVLTSNIVPEERRPRELHVRPRGDQYGAYASARLDLADRWTADIGLRWDRSTLSAAHDSELSPRLSLLYELNESTRFRGSWGRFAQLQGIDELQVSDGVGDFQPAQHADHWVASVEHAFAADLSLRVEGFRKEYRDLRPRFENLLNTVVLLPELKPDRLRIAPQRAVAEGVEISLRNEDLQPFFWWFSYTWSRVYDELDGAKMPRRWDQAHALSAGLAWETDRWQLSAASTYRTGWPKSDVTLLTADPIPTAVALRNSSRLKAYFDLDLRLARKFHFGETNTLVLFLELSNVLNRNNECCIEYEYEYEFEDEDEDGEEDEQGERFLEIETINSLPLLPSVGFSWRF
jgi:outer membrane receptor protein involved in Fe transport